VSESFDDYAASRGYVVRRAVDAFGDEVIVLERMRDQMLDHGLEAPLLSTDMRYFQVAFTGPGDNIERLRVPQKQLIVTPAIEAQLNDRQKTMVMKLLQGEELTSRSAEKEFAVTRDTTSRDFDVLVKLGIARKEGKGRSTRYVLANPA
jgi:predicted HTH transcriptional regulator